jgi:hypothetical protein
MSGSQTSLGRELIEGGWDLKTCDNCFSSPWYSVDKEDI